VDFNIIMVFDSHISVRGKHYLLTKKKKLIQRYRIWWTESSAKVFILIAKHVLPLCWRSVPRTPSVFILIAKRMLPLCWRCVPSVPWPPSWVVYEKKRSFNFIRFDFTHWIVATWLCYILLCTRFTTVSSISDPTSQRTADQNYENLFFTQEAYLTEYCTMTIDMWSCQSHKGIIREHRKYNDPLSKWTLCTATMIQFS